MSAGRGNDWLAIREAYPLSGVVREAGVKLRRAGREWSACCPFHHEKTASFYVNDEKQFYHCFGCGAHGDVVDFVSTMKNIPIPEAVASLTGGNTPRLTEEDRKEREAWLKAQEDKRKREQHEGTLKARQRWGRATPVDVENAYVERKKIAPWGCRAEGDSLLVPIHDADGEILSVQAIPSAKGARKDFAAGAPVSGGRMNIGIYFGRVFVCEGFATGSTIYEARADQVCVAFSKGNVARIARELVEGGAHVVIAADANAREEMEALALELGVPVVVAPDLGDAGNDFNDQMIAQGLDAVRETIAQNLIDWANRPAPPPPPPFCSIAFVDAFDFEEAEIPLRPWIVPGAILAGAAHILAAPGGTGKSLFTLQMALMLASGEAWGKLKPKRRCKVMMINPEDDIPEQRRRLAAARTVMGMDTAGLRGQIILADNPSSILMATIDQARKTQVVTPLVAQIVDTIRHHGIDVLIVDPFAETFEGDENSNGDTKWAMKIWRDEVARATGCAVYLVHHTTKGAEDKAGSADVIRGGGAIVNSARLASTLFVMSKLEAQALNIREEERFRYVRYDDAKSNNSLIGARTWFEKVSVVIRNGSGNDGDGGDEVGALKPWEPEGLSAYEPEAIVRLLHAIEAGYVDDDGICHDVPFGRSSAGRSKRWVGHLISDMMGLDESQAKAAIIFLFDRNLIEEYDFEDGAKGRKAKGIRANFGVADRLFASSPIG